MEKMSWENSMGSSGTFAIFSWTMLLKELREKKKVYHLWKEGLAIQEMFRDVARSCRKKIRETRAQ